MKIKSLYIIIIIGLVALNLFTIWSVKSNPNHRGPFGKMRPEPREIIIEKLHFDKSQISNYDSLIKVHQKNIREANENSLAIRSTLYKQLIAPDVDRNGVDSLINALGDQQKQIESIHFHHFEDIKNLCKPEQHNDFYNLVDELSLLFSPHHPPKGND